MFDFLGELLAEFIIGPIISWVFGAVLWVLRTGLLLVFYPLLLLTGWLRLWVREKGQRSFGELWKMHGHSGLHGFGWSEAALDIEYLLATCLIMMAGTGVTLVVYSLGKLWLR
ncbi:hypothetical protein Q5H92_23125 [Hymenobacter sp. M29]|uniref:Uncharacterized protein n=1 Tax=Hymenobacter mellowenesis TaxID=3063995 RepID=A0ABT9AJH2_9BACT|nr:hypothetical protein [Hymenobacter sp. M29]MDO7849275.1 hypothetical protein [Hymenobacter sp. M29]